LKVGGSEPGTGTLRVVDNVAVVTCGPIVGFQEGIIDMSGPGAAYTPFSRLTLVVLDIDVADTLTPHDHETVLRDAGLAAADYIARICAPSKPGRVEDLAWDELKPDSGLPRVAYVYMALSQGLLHDTYVLGETAKTGLPRLLDPRIVLDNGVISGNCVSACDKNTTFHHQNNPLIEHLLRGHGSRWNFVGVVMTNAPTRLAEKQRSATQVIALASEVKAVGAIISKEGFGNPDADLMMIVRGLEQAGVKCVALTDEFAGSDGASQSLADAAVEADAVISTGNANERILLPPMATTIGPVPDVARLAGGYPGSVRADGSMEVELQAIMGATNELGFAHLRCQEN
jgi:glycine reductase